MRRVLQTPLVRVFRNRDYALYTLGNAISLVGLWVQRLAVGWLTWQLTHSGFWLGAVAFADLAPALIVGPFAGVLADRFDRTRILRVTQAISLAQAAALWLLYESGRIDVWILFALTLGLGVNFAITQPARLALIPQLVRAEDMNTAVAMNAVLFNSARFVGPMVAGLIMSVGDLGLTFLFNAVSYVAMVAVLFRLPATPPARRGAPRSVLHDLWQGIRYSAQHDAIRQLLLMSAVLAVLTRPIIDLLPGFAGEVFGTGQGGLVQMTSAMGAGSILAGVWLAQRSALVGLPRVVLTTLGVSGVSVMAFAVVPNFLAALALLFLASGAISMMGTAAQTLVQHIVDEDKRGRVIALWGLIFRGAPALGVLAMGGLSEWLGLQAPVFAGALLCLLYALYALRWRHGMNARVQGDVVQSLGDAASATHAARVESGIGIGNGGKRP